MHQIDYKELQKLYPELKVPYDKEVGYYLKLLQDSGIDIQTIIDNVKDFNATMLSAEIASLTKYKYKKLDEIVAVIKSKYSLVTTPVSTSYTELEFNSYKPNKYYFSIDLKQANYAAFKDTYYNEIKALNWSDWLKEENIELHPILANSKSFRQVVFGNTNPKFLQSVQKSMMENLLMQLALKLPANIFSKLVAKRADELLFEFDDLLSELEYSLIKEVIGSKFKVTVFRISEHYNFGETVKVKHFNSKPDKLMNVPGNRFFLHLKTLVVKKELDERDLYFIQDGHLAKYVI